MKHPRFILADIAQRLEDARMALGKRESRYDWEDFLDDICKIEGTARQAAWDLSNEAIGETPTEQKE